MQNEVINFWYNLDRVQAVLLKSDKEFAQYLGMNYTQFMKRKNARKFLPMNCVFECAEKLNFHFENLLCKDFDIMQLYETYHGSSLLPQRYSHATYSSVRPINNIITYIEKNYGERAKINLFRKFQISEMLLKNMDFKTNVLLMTDSLKYLQPIYQLKNSELIAIGQMTPFTLLNNDIAYELSNKKNVEETLSYFIEELTQRFDKNHSYQIIKKTDSYAMIKVDAHRHVLDELKTAIEDFGSEELCQTRMGVLSSITWFRYRRFAHVSKTLSIFNGGSSNLYKFDLSPFKNIISMPLPPVSSISKILQ